MVGLLGAAFSAASYAVALTLKSEDALAPLLNGIAIPVLLLSGILLPMTLAPKWLRAVSDVNPLKHVVDGLRAMFRGDLGTSTSWWGLLATVAWSSSACGSAPAPSAASRPSRPTTVGQAEAA